MLGLNSFQQKTNFFFSLSFFCSLASKNVPEIMLRLHSFAAEIKPQIHMVNVLGEKINADFNYYS